MSTKTTPVDTLMHIFKKHNKDHDSYFQGSHDHSKKITPTTIEKALKNCEFELFYKPIFNLEEGLHGAEVFQKWLKKDGHYVENREFMPIAEQSQAILHVTHWTLNQTIIDLIFLRDFGFTGCLHINLAAKTLQGDGLLHCAKFLADNHPFSIDQIVFEVTEKAIMEDLDAAKRTMFELSEIGFKLTINDFGEGLPSLCLLQELPKDQIKIDRSLVENIIEDSNNEHLVMSTLYLAKELNFKVVTEDEETTKIVKTIPDLDYSYLQSNHCSKPVSFEHFLNIVKQPQKENTA